MTPFFSDPDLTLYRGDCRAVMASLPDESMQCCVTSPPYFGLRDYGTATWEGGDIACDHLGRSQTSDASTLGDWKNGGGQKYKEEAGGIPFRGLCLKCGATRSDQQIGLEPTPDAYVAEMVGIFREVRRVLKDDGTLWLNLGDSYASGGRKSRDPGQSKIHPSYEGESFSDGLRPLDPPGIKPKDLLGIPWRVAFALQADGYYLRQDIIWHKQNPMPESVTDRCTKAHEYLFLLSKSATYHCDMAAIAEPTKAGSLARYERGRSDTHKYADGGPGNQTIAKSMAHMRSGNKERKAARHRGVPVYEGGGTSGAVASGVPWEDTGAGRNRRSVWTINTKPYPGAHFATFPPKLVEPCIIAGCPRGGVTLDPFNGSGTTGEVARANGCKYIGIELNEDYCKLSVDRWRQGFLFGSGVA